uniref:Uncharacterized protein n=1 Tax=Anguilla anguilla TaxID=7936 RepID=A0A0E9UWE8_ANGAN
MVITSIIFYLLAPPPNIETNCCSENYNPLK